MSRYHKAAIDGNLVILKEATTKDLNSADEDGMTPTLLAALHGRVDALQLICSRGGDPNKSDIWGNTPLHLAAANNHMQILSFLVNFGANVFSLDNDFHTAMDVAASRDRMDCVRYLDESASKETNQYPKKVANKKKEAIKEAEKRVKQCERVKKRHQSKMDKMYRGPPTGTVTEASMEASHMGTINSLSEKNVKNKGGSLAARFKDTLQRRGNKDRATSGPESNVIFSKFENDKPEFLGVFSEQDENILEEAEDNNNEDEDEDAQVKPSIFNRPGLGGLIFQPNMGFESDERPGDGNENLGFLIENGISEAEDELALDSDGHLPWEQEDLGLDDDVDEDTAPLDAFLSSISLPEFALAFSREHLDLEALMLCSDDDLKGIRIQLGPRKKILEAIARRKYALESPGIMQDTSL